MSLDNDVHAGASDMQACRRPSGGTGLVERIVLTSGEKCGEMHAALHGDLATILEWAGSGSRKGATDTSETGMSVPLVAGGRIGTCDRQVENPTPFRTLRPERSSSFILSPSLR